MAFFFDDKGQVLMILKFITLLLLCQLAGEVFVLWSGLPVPGPVVGMALLFVGLTLQGGIPAGLGRVVDGLLSHLSLLFVPAGVGLMRHLSMLRDEWLAISLSLVLSAVLTIAVTGVVMSLLIRWTAGPSQEG
jgi:holin-like protein